MTVGELGERMDSAGLIEWIEFDEIHQDPEWVRTALVCLCMNKLAGGKARLDDFLPARRKAEARPDPGDVNARILAWANARVAAQRGQVAPAQ
jgi:hypothetical protein